METLEGESGGDKLDGEEEPWADSISRDFARARANAWKKTRDCDFATTIDEFRNVEQVFVNRAGANEAYVQYYKRCIADDLFEQAVHYKDAPFDSCYSLWKELNELGFSEVEERCFATRAFARFCKERGQAGIGLSLLDPLLADLERLRADPAVTLQAAKYYDQEIESGRKLRAELLAQRP